MEPWDKSYGRSTKRIECQGICDDTQGRRSAKSMVGWTIESKSHSEIKIKICSTMLLHSKEGWISIVGTKLQEAQSDYDKGQNAITINWRSNWQVQGSEILQQIGSNLGIQQHPNQRRRWIESCISNQQRAIWTTGHVFQTMQFAGNVSKNDEQYIPRTTPWRSIGKLYGWLHDTSQDYEGTREKDSSIFEDSGEVQPVFQKIKMWF